LCIDGFENVLKILSFTCNVSDGIGLNGGTVELAVGNDFNVKIQNNEN
jgi:hypothetical protein